MGLDFVAFDESGETVLCESVTWMRDYAPTELFYGNKFAMKSVLTTEDITGYWKDFHDYLKSYTYIPASPEDDTSVEAYDRWISADDKDSIDDRIFQKLMDFQGLLYKCVDLKLSGKWSF